MTKTKQKNPADWKTGTNSCNLLKVEYFVSDTSDSSNEKELLIHELRSRKLLNLSPISAEN